ncbi:MAG: YraN family protein [Saprospiraceae bacterium]
MLNKTKAGIKGETTAIDYLEKSGYKILERNWRFKRAEIDIIAKEIATDILVFIEVKARSYDYFGEPELSVNEKKILLISDAAAAYMEKISYSWEIRFDIISIVFDSKIPKINHFKDAFLI